MSGKFVLKKGEAGKFHFNLLAANGRTRPRTAVAVGGANEAC
jgi:hypothetical protein